jgi:hypothetical protein
MFVAGRLGPLIEALGGLGLLFAFAAVLLRRRFVAAALFTVASEYVVVEATGRAEPVSVVAYAVGLIVLAELLLTAAEYAAHARADRTLVIEKAVAIGRAAVAAALLALVTLTAATVRLPAGFEAALLGSAAAVALLALPWLLLTRQRGPQR